VTFAVIKLALDRSSRRVDVDGRLHIDKSHISKAQVSPYYGREIPNFQALGLDENKIYKLFRDPVELDRAAPTFARLPILKNHTEQPVTADSPEKELIIGAIGSDVAFNAPYLDADLVFWDAPYIAAIETDKVKELSCGYRYVAVMESGEFEGQAYDGRMTDIVGNHLALVEVGRAGSDVVVADSNPFITEVNDMKMSKLGKALFATLSALSPVLAADAALPALVGKADKKSLKMPELKAALIAKDASLDSTKLDSILDAILDVEQDPKAVEPVAELGAADESPADKLRKVLEGKVEDDVLQAALACVAAPAADEDAAGMTEDDGEEKDVMKKADVVAAMDSLRAGLMAAQKAAVDVRPVVGDVIGCDSAEEIYGLALDHLKVDRKDVTGVAALKALYTVASKAQTAPSAFSPTLAADAANKVTELFPKANRFTQA